jgi:amino acid permease
MQILNDKNAVPAGCAIGVVNEFLSVYLELQGALNAEAEREKLRKKKDELQKLVLFNILFCYIVFLLKILSNKLFEVLM